MSIDTIKQLDDDEIEDIIYDEQEKYIVKEFGKKHAKNANYGWGVDGEGKNAVIQTKVYGIGNLTSRFVGDEVIHSLA